MTDQTSFPTALERELVALGRTVVVDPPAGDLVDRVLSRIIEDARVEAPTAAGRETATGAEAPMPSGSWLGARRRLVAVAAAVAAVLTVALVPPVRAAVLDLLRIGGVSVREVPTPQTGSRATTSPSAGSPDVVTPDSVRLGSVREVSQRVGFDVAVPASLGPPTTVALSRQGRVVELTWGSGPGSTRLDAFDGTLSYGFLKSVWDVVTPTDVGGQDAVWLAKPHRIEWTDRSGATVSSSPRVAGPTLVWVDRDVAGREVTYRLEGPATLDAAQRIAESAP